MWLVPLISPGRRSIRIKYPDPVEIPPPIPEPIVTSVDEIIIPNLERALRRKRRGDPNYFTSVTGSLGDLKFVHVARKRGRTQIVLDYVFDDNLNIVHLGLKGLRGWDPRAPERVDLPVEFDFATGGTKGRKVK